MGLKNGKTLLKHSKHPPPANPEHILPHKKKHKPTKTRKKTKKTRGIELNRTYLANGVENLRSSERRPVSNDAYVSSSPFAPASLAALFRSSALTGLNTFRHHQHQSVHRGMMIAARDSQMPVAGVRISVDFPPK